MRQGLFAGMLAIAGDITALEDAASESLRHADNLRNH